jgi:hypothetical protein
MCEFLKSKRFSNNNISGWIIISDGKRGIGRRKFFGWRGVAAGKGLLIKSTHFEQAPEEIQKRSINLH